MCAKGIPFALAVATPPIQFLCSSFCRRFRIGPSGSFARGMRAVQNPVRRLHGHPTTVGGRFQPSRLAGGRSRSSQLRSPNKTKAQSSLRPGRNYLQVLEKGFLKEAVNLVGMKSCPVLLTARGVNKTGQQRWLRRIDRVGRVRASVRSHGAQASARTGRQRGALPLAVQGTVRRAALGSSTRRRASA